MRCKDLRSLLNRLNAIRIHPLPLTAYGKNPKDQINQLQKLVWYFSHTIKCPYCKYSDDGECCEACDGHGRLFPNPASREDYAKGPQMRGIYRHVPFQGGESITQLLTKMATGNLSEDDMKEMTELTENSPKGL